MYSLCIEDADIILHTHRSNKNVDLDTYGIISSLATAFPQCPSKNSPWWDPVRRPENNIL